MNLPKLPTNRRFWVPVILLSIFVLVFWRHIILLCQILSVYPLWPLTSGPLALSLSRDGLDTTFERYPIEQWSVRWPPQLDNQTYPAPDSPLLRLKDGSLARLPHDRYGGSTYDSPDAENVVPAVIHHILLGMDRRTMPKAWETSRNSCLALHPESANYTHYFWDDASALQFMTTHYPFFLRDFLSYRHNIQRADALRYFVLHHFGGIFLDLDLECRRSLGPLRRFPITNINAFPVGVSNGFMMAAAGHPFTAQLIRNLKHYDRSWLGIPYADIMFSTGPMFLSTEHLRYSATNRAHDLRILAGPEQRLNGKVVTPLFRHLGSSSWHQGDAQMLLKIKDTIAHPVVAVGLLGLLVGAALVGAWWTLSRLLARRGFMIIRPGSAATYYALEIGECRRTSPSRHRGPGQVLSQRFVLWRLGLARRASSSLMSSSSSSGASSAEYVALDRRPSAMMSDEEDELDAIELGLSSMTEEDECLSASDHRPMRSSSHRFGKTNEHKRDEAGEKRRQRFGDRLPTPPVVTVSPASEDVQNDGESEDLPSTSPPPPQYR